VNANPEVHLQISSVVEDSDHEIYAFSVTAHAGMNAEQCVRGANE